MYEKDYDYEENARNPRNWSKIIVGVLLVVGCIIAAFYYTYNKIVEKEEDVNLARSNVESMLQRRLELIPDVVKIVEANVKHKENLITGVNDASEKLLDCLESGNVGEIGRANQELSKQIEELLDSLKVYPEITSNREYIGLMDQLEGSVNRISIARDEYNKAVNEYNRAVRKFPICLYAHILGFDVLDTFEANPEAKSPNIVQFRE